MCNTVSDLTGAAERLRSRPRDGRTPDQVGRELRTLRHLIDLLELEFATTAAEFAATDQYELEGANSATEWIRHECRLSVAAASHAVDVGEQAARLPESTAALLQGRLGYGHLALLAGTAAAVLRAVDRFDEARYLPQPHARGPDIEAA